MMPRNAQAYTITLMSCDLTVVYPKLYTVFVRTTELNYIPT
jgi:hypothetical protein